MGENARERRDSATKAISRRQLKLILMFRKVHLMAVIDDSRLSATL